LETYLQYPRKSKRLSDVDHGEPSERNGEKKMANEPKVGRLVVASVAEDVSGVAVGLDDEVGDLGSVSSRSDAVPGGRAGVAGDADLVGGVAHLDDSGDWYRGKRIEVSPSGGDRPGREEERKRGEETAKKGRKTNCS
jgi:hypothetical protein